jgi:membrane protein
MSAEEKINEGAGPRTFFREVFEEFSANDCMLMAAAISFYSLLSLIPLVFLGVAFLGYLVGSSEGAVEQVIDVLIEFLPLPVVERVQQLLHSLIATKTIASIIGFLSLLWVGMWVFETIERAVNIVHRVEESRGFLRRHLVGVFMMVTSGTLVLLSFLLSPLLLAVWSMVRGLLDFFEVSVPYASAMNDTLTFLWRYVAIPVPFFLMLVVFLLIYLVAPAKAIAFSSTLLGATAAALLWQLAKEIYSYFLLHYARYDELYGPLGAVIGLILWIYYTAVILLLGAEMAYVHERRRVRKRHGG